MMQAYLLNLLQPLATLTSGIGKKKKLLIMIYHRVLDEPDFMRPGEVDRTVFTWQMQLIAKHFNVLPLSEALERMQNDTLPPRAVCITFDDGYADNYTNALPILQLFNLKATFFIASGFLDGGRMWNDSVIEAVRNLDTPILDLREQGLGEFEIVSESQKCQAAQQIIQKIKHLEFTERARHADAIAAKSRDLPTNLMMSSAQLKKLHHSGMEIGGHTVNHPILAKLSDLAVERELKENKLYLESFLNTQLRHFAYPNGKSEIDYSSQQIELVKKIGYEAALSTDWGGCSCITNKWKLPRFTPWDNNPVAFVVRIIRLYIKQGISY